MTTKRKQTRPQETYRQRFQRYSLIGAALGLYFGFFFRPAREPDPLFVIGLAALAALVMTFLRMRREKAPTALARYGLRTFALYALALLILEGRHWAFEAGGRTAVVLMTTLLGAVTGASMARWGSF